MNALNTIEAIKNSALGAELDPDECQVLADRMGTLSLAADETLVEEGDERHTLFLLAAGRLCVCRRVGTSEEIVHHMRPGECAGTRAFVDRSVRKAGLRAEIDSQVMTLEPVDFEALIDSHPRLVFKMMRAIFRITHSNLMRMNRESAEMRNYLLKTGGRY
ncbi:putative transcriptional regulator, Crp/Fnr family [Thiorhodococcus drewsii AZ1]|uniref:Putative transcriptional regulator, Crp/Fnr family n=1 Tax=Thiorhodococcus drewsii AZ1 TaxID=765913 RepID=G2E1U2_9GAMM|nr:cyclic nucleotide-binding domain-containing protein [Thiorhodococcus drewsii]EGV31150.1 putative transcriptional regulator, Crp/Fnr family [Thiorhodococcus drewsii AZ1]